MLIYDIYWHPIIRKYLKVRTSDKKFAEKISLVLKERYAWKIVLHKFHKKSNMCVIIAMWDDLCSDIDFIPYIAQLLIRYCYSNPTVRIDTFNAFSFSQTLSSCALSFFSAPPPPQKKKIFIFCVLFLYLYPMNSPTITPVI